MLQGFLLGLASGTTCLATCAPVLIPLLLGEGKQTRQNWALLGQFLGGRLVGYLLFALFAWASGQLVLAAAGGARSPLFGAAYVLLAAALLVYGLGKWPTVCAGSLTGLRARLARWPALLPLGLGLLTGLNLCPPFLLAFTGAADGRSLLNSLAFFALFFVGTSLYFLPLPFVGLLRRFDVLRTVGRLAAVVVAVYYLFTGIIMIAGGFVTS